jgi:hypothetical protein
MKGTEAAAPAAAVILMKSRLEVFIAFLLSSASHFGPCNGKLVRKRTK